MKIYDRNSSMKYEGSDNEARRLRYARKLQDEDEARAVFDDHGLDDMSDMGDMGDMGEWADRVVLDDYDLHTQDAPDDDLGAARACLAMLAVWLIAVTGWVLW